MDEPEYNSQFCFCLFIFDAISMGTYICLQRHNIHSQQEYCWEFEYLLRFGMSLIISTIIEVDIDSNIITNLFHVWDKLDKFQFYTLP